MCCWDLCHYDTGHLSRQGKAVGFPNFIWTTPPISSHQYSLGSQALLSSLGVCCWSRQLIQVNATVMLAGPLRKAGAMGTLQVVGSLACLSPQPWKGLEFPKSLSKSQPRPLENRSFSGPLPSLLCDPFVPALGFGFRVEVETSKWTCHHHYPDAATCVDRCWGTACVIQNIIGYTRHSELRDGQQLVQGHT